MRFLDIIEQKRDGKALSSEQIHFWISEYVKGNIPDYQVSALLMAIYFQGMDEKELFALTKEMMFSGDVIDLSAIQGIKTDKHSTGGVGDKTSLALGPMVAACGGKVAKMSGRGLGHTGGTLDKLESIEGFKVQISEDDFIKQVNDIGIAIIGQSATLVPADKKLYALRDVSGSVPSIPLIASSIMSKKLASGADTILLDVKYGDGAFMKTKEEAKKLQDAMISIGKAFGKDTRVVLSDMNQPLGCAIGNALEVKEAIDTLKGTGPKDFTDLCVHGGGIMLVQAKIAENEESGQKMIRESIENGSAFAKLVEMVKAQHGNVEQILNPSKLPQAKYIIEMKSKVTGTISQLYALKLGLLAMKLGAGRKTLDDTIDHAVGIVLTHKKNDKVNIDETLAYIHTNDKLDETWINEFYDSYEFV